MWAIYIQYILKPNIYLQIGGTKTKNVLRINIGIKVRMP
uniref:GM08026p n=1 Tax=Drosophila melanogaster TaxID=7227 RepID=Q95S65_DROME|nr:GM08026p [Drosophila melanogaster]